jgi:hypothetical protein
VEKKISDLGESVDIFKREQEICPRTSKDFVENAGTKI